MMLQPIHILIVDDDKNLRLAVADLTKELGYQTDEAADGQEALQKIAEKKFGLILLDLAMPRMDGMQVLRRLHEKRDAPEVIIITNHASIPNAVEATRLGAFDFIDRDEIEDRLPVSMRNALRKQQLEQENQILRNEKMQPGELLGESATMQQLRRQITTIAQSDATVLIFGESGSGKELVATAIHQNSRRAKMPYVTVNCSALTETLLESELFGHIKGAFTGASFAKKGKFEIADGGTLFLDEIGDMSLAAQAKVLRALENGDIEKVGSAQNVRVNVRIIAATNKTLKHEIKENRFREDLYHRLNVITIHIPPLRDRLDDLKLLSWHFLRTACRRNFLAEKILTEEAISELLSFKWPGNVRELKNLMERVAVLSSSETVEAWELIELWQNRSFEQATVTDYATFQPLDQVWRRFETDYIRRALSYCHGNVTETAQLLGLNRSYLHEKMKDLEIGKKDR